MSISFNPAVTTTAAGSFNVFSTGYIQGFTMDDPTARNTLAGGILASTETLPMWGGVGISEANTPLGTFGVAADAALGSSISRATSVSTIGAGGSLTGFSVFNQNVAAINTPQSPVPLIGNGGQVNFHRFGSNARVAVACDPSLVGPNITTMQVSWDFLGQQLVPYVAAYNAATPTAYSYTPSTGILALTFSAAPTPAVGDDVGFTGCNVAGLNGTWKVTAVSGDVLSLQAPTGLSGTPTAGGITAGGGALPVRVLDVATANCLNVLYSTITGFATWNPNGACALILI